MGESRAAASLPTVAHSDEADAVSKHQPRPSRAPSWAQIGVSEPCSL